MLALPESSSSIKSFLTMKLAFVLVFGSLVPSDFAATRPQVSRPANGETALRNSKTPLATTATTQQRARNALAKFPVSFEPNRGQADRRVKFLSRGSGHTLWLTSSEAVLRLHKPGKKENEHKPPVGGEKFDRTSGGQSADIKMKLAGANRNPRVEGLDQLPGKVNYFTGNDPKKWRTGLANYARVKYNQVYPGIDLVYYGHGQQLEYDFVVAPGADPNKIRMEFKGADGLEVDTSGDLVLHTAAGELHHRKPLIYQEVNGKRHTVAGRFVPRGKRQIEFNVGTYDRTKPLMIDPVIAYATLLGPAFGGYGSANGIATYTAPDGKVYVYVVGRDFPAKNSVQPPFTDSGGVFVAKFDMSVAGDASLIYSTSLSGGDVDERVAGGIAVDSAGNAYVTGFTTSTDFPILKAAQSSGDGSDAFVTVLNADGASLIYSTLLGGLGRDYAAGIAVDTAGNAFVTGTTHSANFPIVNAYQSALPFPGAGAVFVTKIAPPVGLNPASIAYSTYLGGSPGGDGGSGIALNSAGNVYVTGTTMSPSFPIVNGFQTILKCYKGNAFVAKLNPSAIGSASLLYSTYIGGSCGDHNQPDEGFGIATDATGNAYVTGITSSLPASDDFPTTPGAFMRTRNNVDTAFITKIDTTKTGTASLTYSTLLGTQRAGAIQVDIVYGIAVDAAGNAYVAGETSSFSFPLVNPVQSSNRGVFQSLDGGSSWVATNNGLTVPGIRAIALDTTSSPRTLYAAASPSWGVFKSIDGGLSWSAINTGLTSVDIRSLLVSPVNPSVIYVGTAGGVFRSTDGGSTWSSFNLGITGGDASSVNTLTADTATVNGATTVTLYAGTAAGLYKMVEGANGWSFAGLNQFVRKVAFDPKTSPHTIYTTGKWYGDQAYRSIDGGATWTALSLGGQFCCCCGIGSLAVDTNTSPSTLYALGPDYMWLWKSTDSGSNWERINLPTELGDSPDIVVDHKTTPSTLYTYAWAPYNPGTVYTSEDGGLSWIQIFDNGTGALVVDTASPSSPSPLYLGTNELVNSDAFVARLDPTGSAVTFSTPLGGHGLDQAYGIALDSSGNIYVAGRTRGPFSTVNGYQTSNPSALNASAFVLKLGSASLPSVSSGNVTTQVATQTGTLELSFPNITGSTSGSAPIATVNPLDSTATANLTLSNNLGAYEIKTTATCDTSGYATDPTKGIKLSFNVLTVNDPAVFNGLVITHGEDQNGDGIIQPNEMVPYNGTVDPNKITYHDFASRTVWVYVPSLSPLVIVKGANDQFNDLIRVVKSFNLKAGIENSLDAKLQNALKAYQAALAKDRATACNLMDAFVSETQAQVNKALTPAQANQLIAAARQIKVLLGCR